MGVVVGRAVGIVAVSVGGARVGESIGSVGVGAGSEEVQEIKIKENKIESTKRKCKFLRMGRIVLLTLCFVNYADSSS